MSNVKLHINISQGIIDAEGDQDFVWRVYEDFRDRLAVSSPPVGDRGAEEEPAPEDKVGDNSPLAQDGTEKRRRQKRRSPSNGTPSNKDKGAPSSTYRPKILTDLDTTGIKEFLGQYQLTNHTDYIVAMSRFLENKGVSPASFDAFYTCYSDAGLKVPEAFGQAFIRARGGKGYVTFTTPYDVALTIRGKNHIDHGGIKKANA